jgi:uncharacterized protein YqeY
MKMTKIELVRQEMNKALKAKDTTRREALSMLLSALKNKAIDKREDLTEDEENAVVYREIKEAQETLDTCPPDRAAIIGECRQRIAVYSEFAPQRMGEDEIREIVRGVLSQLGIEKATAQDKGRIMKTLMPLVKGKADGALVGKIVEASME